MAQHRRIGQRSPGVLPPRERDNSKRCVGRSSPRQLALTYDAQPDWSPLSALTDPAAILAAASSLLENETFSKTIAFDALKRPVSITEPDSSEFLPSYNEAGQLDGVDVKIRGAATATTFVENIDYDSKGRREKIEYGNATTTTYDYDPLTYRLTRIKTTRLNDPGDDTLLQNLFYTYDPSETSSPSRTPPIKRSSSTTPRSPRSPDANTMPSIGS